MRATINNACAVILRAYIFPTLLLPVLVWTSPLPQQGYGEYVPRLTVTVEEVEARRVQLNELLFGQPGLPATLPADGAVPLPNGLSSILSGLAPDEPNGAAIIYHAGHDGMNDVDLYAVRRFAQAGYITIVLQMPLVGPNEPPTLDIPHVGQVTLTEHAHLEQLDSITEGSPLRYFIEPVISLVNELTARGYERIYMVGLSGGGWTTTVAAAIDPRITASYPVAGSVPLGARWTSRDLRTSDWEQVAPELYSIANYTDLYLMGAYQRRQIQVLNARDNCCFSDPRHEIWEEAVSTALGDAGEFRVLWDTTATFHAITPWAVDQILVDMARDA